MSNYYYKRGRIYYYRRRIPECVAPYETRREVIISLSTKDEKEAIRKAAIYNDYIEEYWRNLVKTGQNNKNKDAEFKTAVKLAKAHGFAYKNITEIARAPLEDVIERVNAASKVINREGAAPSILGVIDEPQIFLSDCVNKFDLLCADRLVNKSDNQIRKWKNPRIAGINSFIDIVGDKAVQDVTRADVLLYRTWGMKRVENGEIIASTVNKNMRHIRDFLHDIKISYEIDVDFKLLFSEIRLKEIDKSRPPFEADFVQNILLSPDNLKTLNTEARLLVYAMADTGARESELIGLRDEDIFLNDDIPYIWIRPYKNNALKTSTSERKIPLVGSALYAFRQLPTGFIHYGNADSASTAINKYLRENNLKPTPDHSLYSLRHTFKDRLRDAGAPEEVIDELMGHKKSGPKYGRGHMLENKYF